MGGAVLSSVFDAYEYKESLEDDVNQLTIFLEDPLFDVCDVADKNIKRVKESLGRLIRMFGSQFCTISTKVKYIAHLKSLGGFMVLLELVDRIKYETLALEAVSLIAVIIKIPEGAAEIDAKMGRDILQRCSKRFGTDEFVPDEVEYALKRLNKQQAAIRTLSVVALKKAIEDEDLAQVLLMMASNVENLNVALPCLLGVLTMADQSAKLLDALCANEAWLILLLRVIDTHNREEAIMLAGATVLTMVGQQTADLRRFIAKEGALGIAVRSLYVYARGSRDVQQQLIWCLDELVKDRKNIKDFVALNGDKAIEACMKSREESKSDKFLPKRIRRLVKETPRIRNELSKSGDFTFRNANFGKALDTIRPIMPKTSLQRSRFGRPVEKDDWF